MSLPMVAGDPALTIAKPVFLIGDDGKPVGGFEYETVAASQTNQALGATGAIGDFLDKLVIVVATAATAQVQIKDGADTAITIFPNSPGGGIGTYCIPVCLRSRTGAWQITTGAGASVIATGNFT